MGRSKIHTILTKVSIISFVCLFSCSNNEKTGPPAFITLDASTSGLHFVNALKPTPEFNMMKYMYYYNGAGVGTGDFNNDGKPDLFFASNQGQNTMYLNEGGMHFRDITKEAGIPNDGGWSTGVSVVDINNDGLLDIYICRVGKYKILKGKNQLLICKEIRNGVPIYEDKAAEYGLDFSGFSTQAAFFDMDNDGDLDLFLLNHSVNHDGNFAPRQNFLNTYDSLAGDRIFKNENGHFIDYTKQSGINSSRIGYGLGIAISDINMDGWPDIYIGNDFHENDYLYINQHNGTFKEELNDHIMHTSQFSMGVDVADINNDAYPDIISMDMLPDDPDILKRSLGEDDYQTFQHKLDIGYNHQYARNNLQLNRRNGMFSETGFYSGVYATDWSWSALWVDFDNDSKKDLFISNGIPKRLNDIDYINYMSNDVIQDKIQNNQMDEKEMALIEKFPEIKLPNRFFQNKGNAKFDDISGFVKNSPNTFSNGAVYADLDNDGDMDIVVNNIQDPALIYENNSSHSNYSTQFELVGPSKNRNAIGAKIFVFANKEIATYENFPVKGFLSSMNIPVHVGFGRTIPDSVILVWPDNTFQYIQWDSLRPKIRMSWQENLPHFDYGIITGFYKRASREYKDITRSTGLLYRHEENDFNEFNREPLIPKMFSTEGPALAVGDVNGDGLEDMFVGSSKWKQGKLFIQEPGGHFKELPQPSFYLDSTYEDVDACFVDVNNDHFPDLVIASGGNEFYLQEEWRQPRVYLNDGKGNFSKLADAFPALYTTQSCVLPFDFNGDGNMDLFIGGRTTAFAYGKPPPSFLLQNDGTGHFKNVTEQWAKGLSNAGFVTGAVWTDINGDGKKDLVISTEWGGIKAYVFQNGKYEEKILLANKGWWNMVYPIDIDGDGDMDLIVGNQGQNCRLQPTENEPVRMYCMDFDKNGTMEQVVTWYLHNREIPLASKMELEKQLPYLKKKYLYAGDFAKASLGDLLGTDNLSKAMTYEVTDFSNIILINDGKGNFTRKELPWQAQLSCIRDAIVTDANGDGLPDIITGGNFYEQAMQLNRNDADFGTVLINQGKGEFKAETLNGVLLKSQVRHFRQIRIGNKSCILVANNNDSLVVMQ